MSKGENWINYESAGVSNVKPAEMSSLASQKHTAKPTGGAKN